MSLKVFHVVFIIMAIALAVLCAAWSFGNHTAPAFGWCSVLAALILCAYGVWFFRKARNIIT